MSETNRLLINRSPFTSRERETLRDVVDTLDAEIAAEVATLNATIAQEVSDLEDSIAAIPTAPTETLIVQSATVGPVNGSAVPVFFTGTELTFDLVADTNYLLEGAVFFSADSGTGVGVNFDSSTATGTLLGTLTLVGRNVVTTPTAVSAPSASIGSSSVMVNLNENNATLLVNLYVQCTASGTLQLNWANGFADSETYLQAGSYLKLREVE